MIHAMNDHMTHEYKNSRVSLLDCIEGMKQYPDKYFDLAVVDPPYKNETDGLRVGYNKKKDRNDFSFIYFQAPTIEYVNQLNRVSKNQIIWGFNYFLECLTNTDSVIIWNKHQNGHFSECELAWSSFGKTRIFDYAFGKDLFNKIHPTQKPIALYDWIYEKYLPQGGKVLDTHLGSQSNRISAFKRGNIDFTAFELDIDYFREGNARFDAFVAKYEPASEIDKTADGQFKMF